jgi:hypothetical protein
VSESLRRIVGRTYDPSVPIAETCRRVGDRAERWGMARPSYETVRTLVHELRSGPPQPSTAAVLVDIALRSRPPEALLDHLSGTGVPLRR